MKRKIRISLLSIVAFAVVLLFATFANVAAATTGETGGACPITYPGTPSFGNFNDFVNSTYFNEDLVTGSKCVEIPQFDFEKVWYVAAIATEAGNSISIKFNGTNVFSTENCALWGLYSLINFDSYNLQFVDETGGLTISLDPYCPANGNSSCSRFKVCQLTQDSNPLNYLSNPTNLLKGDLIIGFDDSGSQDFDYDDLIVALRAVNTKANPRFVIEKGASKEVFEGEGFCFVWTNSLTCEADVYGCGPDQPCDPLATNTCVTETNLIEGTPISEITDLDSENKPAVFFGLESGTCKPVYIKFGENTTRCAIVGGTKYCK